MKINKKIGLLLTPLSIVSIAATQIPAQNTKNNLD